MNDNTYSTTALARVVFGSIQFSFFFFSLISIVHIALYTAISLIRISARLLLANELKRDATFHGIDTNTLLVGGTEKKINSNPHFRSKHKLLISAFLRALLTVCAFFDNPIALSRRPILRNYYSLTVHEDDTL